MGLKPSNGDPIGEAIARSTPRELVFTLTLSSGRQLKVQAPPDLSDREFADAAALLLGPTREQLRDAKPKSPLVVVGRPQ